MPKTMPHMTRFRDVSIARKLRAIMTIACGLSLILAMAGILLWEWTALQAWLSTTTLRTAQIMAGSCKAALAAGDTAHVEEQLSTLSAEPSITYACIFDRSGAVAAEYRRSPDFIEVIVPEMPLEAAYTIEGDYMLACDSIAVNEEIIGGISIQSDLGPLKGLLAETVQIVGVVFLVSLVVAYLLSAGLQRLISAPLLRLAATAKAITLEGNYALRAKGDAKDEIGVLVRLFNQMLDQIQRRDHALSHSKEELASQVDQRTAELRKANVRLRNEVTQHQQTETALRESQARFQDVALSSGDWIWETDEQWTYTLAAGKVKEILGYEGEDIVGKTCFGLMPQEERDRVRALLADCARKQEAITDLENWNVTRDNRRVCIMTNGVPVLDEIGRLVGYRGVAKDITSRKQTEIALQQSKDLAEAASKAKSEFLAKMSHEIRTPMNGVIGMLDLLRDTMLDTKQSRYVGLAKSSARSLLDIINDILDFSKIEAGKLDLDRQDFEIVTIVEDVIEMLTQQAHAKNNVLLYEIDPAVCNDVVGDSLKFRQILINLVSNGVKFTENGRIHLCVKQEQETENEVLLRVSVTDTGIGIPPGQMNHLFELFSQVDSSMTRKFGGTGLGLAISKRLVEMMEGKIGVESEPGKGSLFWFTARLRKQENPTRDKGRANPPTSFTGTRVLAVGDHPRDLEVLRTQLTGWGCSAAAVRTGGEALEVLSKSAAEQNPFSVVILDADGPDAQGMEVIRCIMSSSDLRDLRLILLASSEHEPDLPDSLEEGTWRCITKPVRPSELYNALTEIICARSPQSPQADQGAGSINRQMPATPVRHEGRILLAEDNEINQEVAREILTRAGYHVDTAADGRSAIDAIARDAYDAVLMDCQMPEMDGYETTRNLREQEKAGTILHRSGQRLPIIALTAHAISGDRERCLEAGMDDYLSKPIDPAKLIEMVNTYVGSGVKSCEREQDQPDHRPVDGREEPFADGHTSQAAPINLEALLNRCSGSHDFLARILAKFETKTTEVLDAMEQSIRAGDAAQVRFLAHSLKGSAANLAAESLSRAARELEQRAASGDLTSAEVHLETLHSEFRRYLDYVTQATGAEGDNHEDTDRRR